MSESSTEGAPVSTNDETGEVLWSKESNGRLRRVMAGRDVWTPAVQTWHTAVESEGGCRWEDEADPNEINRVVRHIARALAASEAQRVRVEGEWDVTTASFRREIQALKDALIRSSDDGIKHYDRAEAAEQRLREVATNLEAAQRAFRNEMLVTARRLVDDALRAALDGDAAGDSTTDGGVP